MWRAAQVMGIRFATVFLCLAPTSDGFAAIARCQDAGDRCSDRLSVGIDRRSKELYIQRNG